MQQGNKQQATDLKIGIWSESDLWMGEGRHFHDSLLFGDLYVLDEFSVNLINWQKLDSAVTWSVGLYLDLELYCHFSQHNVKFVLFLWFSKQIYEDEEHVGQKQRMVTQAVDQHGNNKGKNLVNGVALCQTRGGKGA